MTRNLREWKNLETQGKEKITISLIWAEAKLIKEYCKKNNLDVIEQCINILNEHYKSFRKYPKFSKEDLQIILE